MALDTTSDFTQVAREMSRREPLAEELGYCFYGWVSRLEDKNELAIFKEEIFGEVVMWDVETVEKVSQNAKRVTMMDKNQESMVRLASNALKLRCAL